jgi:hypothetical protein
VMSFIICTHPQTDRQADQIKENEVGGTCVMHGKGEKSVQGFCGKARKKETARKTGA